MKKICFLKSGFENFTKWFAQNFIYSHRNSLRVAKPEAVYAIGKGGFIMFQYLDNCWKWF